MAYKYNKRKKKQREPLDIDPRALDYKNLQIVRRVISNYAKILPAKRLGTDAKTQRKLAQAVKRARYMALIPYVRR